MVRGKRLRFLVGNMPFYLLATLLVLPFAIPLAWLISASLRAPGLPPPRHMEWFPSPPAWGNYRTIFQFLPLGRYLFNSLVVSMLGVILSLVVASWAGFGMSQVRQTVRRRIFVFSLGLLLIPLTALWLGRFLLFNLLGWMDTYLALLAPVLIGSSPFYILLYDSAFQRLSPESFESARLDGAGLLTLWGRIGLPQVRPTTAAVAVLTFIFYWNDFIHPLIYLKSQHLYTLAVGLQQLQQLDRTNWPLLLAGAVVMTLPVIILFLLIQRFLLQEYRF